MREPEAAATAAEIIAILGPVDEVVLADILRTGVTAGELQEAFVRLQGDDAVGPATWRGAAARVVEVMAILEAAEIGPEDGGG